MDKKLNKGDRMLIASWEGNVFYKTLEMHNHSKVLTNLLDNDLLYPPRNGTRMTLSIPLDGKSEEVANKIEE